MQTGKKELLFDAAHTKHTPPTARPLEEQEERESQRLWHDTTEAVKRRDQEAATEAKAKIEDRQREEAAKRNNEGIDWHPQLFRRVQGGHGGSDEGEEDLDWVINAKVLVNAPVNCEKCELIGSRDGKTPEEQVKQILQIHAILPGQKPERQFNIPSRANSLRPTLTNQSVQDGPPAQPVESAPAVQPQQQEQAVGNLIDLHDPADSPANVRAYEPTHRISLPKDIKTVDPNYPPTLPIQSPQSPHVDISPEKKEKIAQELPPSKLLHSNPQEETHANDLLKRKDSETQEDDEFHDAQS